MSKYTSQFKLHVAMEAAKAKTYSEVARKYNLESRNVKQWAEDYKKYGDLAFVENGPTIFQERRIRELEKQVADLEEENAILKKATAYFSRKNL